MARSCSWLLAILVALAATALLLSTAWHLSSSTLDAPTAGNLWYTRWRSTDPLAYRRQIQLATQRDRKPAPFDHVYVLSLPAREDRRADMRRLARALAIDITFVDAADKEEPFLQWIAERVAESRQLRRQVMAEARQVAPESVGGMSIGSDWVTPFPGNLSSSKRSPARFPPYPTTKTYGSNNRHWVSHLEALAASGGHHTSLRPSLPSLNVTALLWDPLEPLPVRQVHRGVISTYWGQTRAIKRMLENGDTVALILEDDVDVEWDLIDGGLWDQIEQRLPRRSEDGEYDWDVTFLGHCWGGEFQKPQYLHPLLHRSTGPMCLHGYALTSRGAHRLLSHLLDPWSAFSTAVDLVIPSLLHLQSRHGALEPPPLLLESFSVVPPLIVQRKDGPSDLQRGNGSKWRGLLRDSTVERIRRDRGEWSDDWEDRDPDDLDERWVDPALRLRCAPV